MTTQPFGTVLTAMITPFTDSGEVDYDKVWRLSRYLVDNGSDGLVVTGTTGESPVLTSDEKVAIYRAVVEAVNAMDAETLILDGLRSMVNAWELIDVNGTTHGTDLTLIDKGWKGSWTEDGTQKTWASQPVETFCMEMGLRRFLPAKGAPNYQAPKPSPDCIVGDNWHMNRGEGAERRCTEVIWNANHWHMLVEELFMLPEDDRDRFELFDPSDGIWTNHKAFGEHITAGAGQLKEQLARGSRSRKPKFIRDHWWDSTAMMLVAQSVETWMRENVKPASRRPMQAKTQRRRSDEIGAR